jgi:tellurite methyltransferase
MTMKEGLSVEKTDTAHLEWDLQWRTPEGRGDWIAPERDVIDIIPRLKAAGVREVLDLGCGVGRHSLLLAGSECGIDFLEKQAEAAGLAVETVTAEMTALPYPADHFDYALAWNVVYHGDLPVVVKTIAEVTRVLKPGGFFQGTMLSKRNDEITAGDRIGYNTFRNRGSAEKNHPHFYCDFQELAGLLMGFEVLCLEDREHARPGSFHWHFTARKK